ncbi:osmoprotectant update ABC transporter permease/substrate-binding subunit OpuFB [Neobacillus sp. OS1-32]|uniref:osmoprotectant update ABC transporter permease/substrate-binding subunit OpuFB n=1 Tax=Neobacillus sp. OS1-32 TaxID=3070682 RepID=UPI0027E1D381|nr:osmoprotectant update ABC transporter permease/substrate-binding subunit OpuFB [Neobacillus sp. OS1-32]WML28635.1 osmoprotectant update ABC transporter permease/substrate-binding subunit OpuFB [Neobacillus sp. OS1-32]
MNNLIAVFSFRKGQLLNALWEHIQISLIALFIAIIIAIPLGIYLTRKRKVAEMIIGITAVLQTIPSLALLGLLIPLFGIGTLPAVIALVAYALLPLLRNTYTGIKEVDPALLEAADAMGMNRRKRLLKVELPLAMPVIMAGIRTATILIVGTATIAALIGAGGLGDIILLGIDRNDYTLIFLGAVPAALLAILLDVLLRQLEKVSFKNVMIAASTFSIIILLIIGSSFIHPAGQQKLVIAGKLGSEPEILINMYKLLIEENTDLKVELKSGLGSTSFVFNALKSKDIDIYPEFSGTAITEFLKEELISTDNREVYDQAKSGMSKKFHMVMLKPMQYNNTYALAVPESLARTYHLEKISDLANVQSDVKAGFTREFTDRSDGYPGLSKKYRLHFHSLVTMESSVRYTAMKAGNINLMDAYSTDGELQKYHLKVLEDDQHFFPPYQGAPLLRQETIDKYPDIVPTLNKLSGKITDSEMRKMNYEVAVQGKSAKTVARNFLIKAGLWKEKK